MTLKNMVLGLMVLGLMVFVFLGTYSQNIFANSEISAGHDHTCSVETKTGTLVKNIYCWGSNEFGQLGRATTGKKQQGKGIVKFSSNDASLTPTDIATGIGHSCAVVSGKAYCWGHNNLGQLGNNAAIDSSVPVLVSGLPSGVAVSKVYASFGDVSCALMSDKKLYCWGDQYLGGVGNGTMEGESSSNRAKRIPSLIASNVVDVSLGVYHGCLLETTTPTNNKMKCWGDNSDGELGVGNFSTGVPFPVDVTGAVSGMTQLAIATGADHTCAINNKYQTYCWGQNNFQQLGGATTAEAVNSPLYIASVFTANGGIANGPVQLSAGVYHTCLRSGNATTCWGKAQEGQLGRSTSIVSTLPPGYVSGATSGVTNFSSGAYHTCFKKGSDTYCVGSNRNAQISLSKYADFTVPNVSLASPVVTGLSKVVGGANHACGIKSNGTAQCWGHNYWGQLGNGNTTGSGSPVAVLGVASASSLAAGINHSCAILGTGVNNTIKCWGEAGYGQLGSGGVTNSWYPPLPVLDAGTPLINIVSVIAGAAHSCALAGNGSVKCWGTNSNGQLGNGNTANASAPVLVTGLSNVTAIAAGVAHNCAILGAGVNNSAKCWGNNYRGQLGNGNLVDSSTPVLITGLGGVAAIAAGQNHTCALINDGTVKCWGDILGFNSTPVQVTGLSGVTAIASGRSHTCALINNGTVKCWGENFTGQLGNGSLISSISPVLVPGLSGVVAIHSGPYSTSTYSVSSTGVLKAWGLNNYNQLGTETSLRVPLLLNSGGTSGTDTPSASS